MITSREELLAEQVNAHIAQMRRADRWWWLADWRDWVRGGLTAFIPTAFSVGMYLWFNSWRKNEWSNFILVGSACLIVGVAVNFRLYQQRKTIARLEERINALEEERDR